MTPKTTPAAPWGWSKSIRPIRALKSQNSWRRKKPSKTSGRLAFSNARPTPSCARIFYHHWLLPSCSPTSRKRSFHSRCRTLIERARWSMPSRRLAAASCSGDRTGRSHPVSSRGLLPGTGIPSARSRRYCSIRPTLRRVSAGVISPFKLTDTQKFKDEVCLLANSSEIEKTVIDDKAAPATPAVLTELPLPLSSAAFISARFPWVSPAATVKVTNPCFGQSDLVRLVDGGYLDNSGVETALGLIEPLRRAAQAAKTLDPSLPAVGIHLISLTGGDFQTRDHHTRLDDAMEPMRRFSAGAKTRAYIAIDQPPRPVSPPRVVRQSKSFNKTDLRSMFYRLPLGWSLSQKTRNIIAHESGRFWDCEPGSEYNQTRSFLSNSDCIQLRVNFLLKGAFPAAMADLQQAETYKASFSSQPPATLRAETCWPATNLVEWQPATRRLGGQKFRLDPGKHHSIAELSAAILLVLSGRTGQGLASRMGRTRKQGDPPKYTGLYPGVPLDRHPGIPAGSRISFL